MNATMVASEAKAVAVSEQCLERRKETANHRTGEARMTTRHDYFLFAHFRKGKPFSV